MRARRWTRRRRKLRETARELETLADGIDQALVAGDADLLREVLGSDTQVLSKALAAPVGIDRVAVFPVDNFGSAMAPLYTTLALFIGSLLILVVVKPTVPGRCVRSWWTRSRASCSSGASA